MTQDVPRLWQLLKCKGGILEHRLKCIVEHEKDHVVQAAARLKAIINLRVT